jgi:hypothetical protein
MRKNAPPLWQSSCLGEPRPLARKGANELAPCLGSRAPGGYQPATPVSFTQTRRTRSGEPCGLGAVELELVNEAGAVVKTSHSAYDGYYTFSEVPVGRYTLRTKLSPGIRASYHPCELAVVIGGDEPIVDGADLTLKPTEGFVTEGARASRCGAHHCLASTILTGRRQL